MVKSSVFFLYKFCWIENSSQIRLIRQREYAGRYCIKNSMNKDYDVAFFIYLRDSHISRRAAGPLADMAYEMKNAISSSRHYACHFCPK